MTLDHFAIIGSVTAGAFWVGTLVFLWRNHPRDAPPPAADPPWSTRDDGPFLSRGER